MPMMTEVNKVSVIEKGQDSGVIMTGDANLSEANYKVSLQNLVNRVLITDQKGAVISTVEDLESQAKYGIVQKILEQEEKKDATQEAKNMLKNSEATAAAVSYTHLDVYKRQIQHLLCADGCPGCGMPRRSRRPH